MERNFVMLSLMVSCQVMELNITGQQPITQLVTGKLKDFTVL